MCCWWRKDLGEEKSKGLIDHYVSGGSLCLGLTATPERLDGKSLLDVFDELTFTRSLVDLVNQGYLCDLECYRVKTHYKMTQVRMCAGDIAPAALRELDADARNEIIIDTYVKNCLTKKTLVFCLNVEHAQTIAKSLKALGISAAAIYGSMPKRERAEIVAKFRSGEISAMCNCQLLTEGFDEPSIEALILARPTKSKSLYCQMIGRGVRPNPGKKICYIYDITDEIHDIVNFNVLGNIPSEGTFEWGDGERLTQAKERHLIHADEIEAKLEQFHILGMGETPATDVQLGLLVKRGAPVGEGLTFQQAAYLLWKSRFMERYGFDSKSYWQEWRDSASGPIQTEGQSTQAQVLQG